MDLATITMQTANVVRGVKPDQLDAPTPCRDWDVGTLTNHLLQVVTALDLAGRGQPVPSDLWERDLPRDDGGARFGRRVGNVTGDRPDWIGGDAGRVRRDHVRHRPGHPRLGLGASNRPGLPR